MQASAVLPNLSLSKLPVKTFQDLYSCTFFFFRPFFLFISFELCTLSSHLITSHVAQSERGSRSLLVPIDAKQRDDRGRERKGNGGMREEREEQRDGGGTE